MHSWARDGRRYLRFDRLAALDGLVHAFSTRPMDVSLRQDEHAALRAQSRRRFARDLGLDPRRVAACGQVHGGRIAVLEREPAEPLLPGCDAAVTNLPGLGLMVFSADCPLVLLYAARTRVLAVVHASWRCTVAGLTRRTVEQMCGRFGVDPEGLYAGVGPSAGPECYEVGPEVYDRAAGLPDREACFVRREGRLCFDLWEANVQWLVSAGVRRERIELAGLCTMCERELLYSYRREGPGCGHFGLLAAIRPDRPDAGRASEVRKNGI